MEQQKPLEMEDDYIVVKMTIEEYIAYKNRKKEQKRRIGKGLDGIAEVFGCSKSHAFKISHQDWFQPAIVMKSGKFLSFDIDMAESLAKQNQS